MAEFILAIKKVAQCNDKQHFYKFKYFFRNDKQLNFLMLL